jgi:hypothetical protein
VWYQSLAALSGAANQDEESSVSNAIDIRGTWRSEGAEDLGNGTFGYRKFDITASRWGIEFTLFVDQSMQMPVFSVLFEGPYEIEGESSLGPGVYNAIFRFDKKSVTRKIESNEIAANFGMQDLPVGQQRDISATGYSFLPSVADYGQEYDLVKVDGGKLYLGARPADNNLSTEERRPTVLGYPLVK